MFVLCEGLRDMKLHDYLDDLSTAERLAFAEAAEITDRYLAQLKSASKKGQHRFPSWKMCKKFIELSGGKLTELDLRPDHDEAYVRPAKKDAA